MRCALAVLAFLFSMYGQEKNAQPSSHAATPSELKQPAKKTQPAAPLTNVDVVNEKTSGQKQNGTKNNPESYLSRLFAPENLPNIGLFLAGIVGICVAIRTLRAIESQTRVLVEGQRPRIVACP